MTEATWSVGRVAKRCGINVSTLHFYENKGLIKSWRNDGNQRRYKPDVLRRISVIKAAQKMGISLEEVKQAFASLPDNRTPTVEDWQLMSQNWQQLLDSRIAYMLKLREYLTGCIGCGCLSMTKCPLYNPDDTLASQGSGPVLLDQAEQKGLAGL
ncbi:redox-sensitive transcriptional activator SoxR [Rheinheimera baltica]|uniref:Redox-sensitive transcriptional activator SoxR n=1 Tax=Rheinheimera baltica TaxID=67576 RepID=A0ABT9I179_9GAMM|nr:redox-sensitive transcriptional activator SoxR [Rheinheimera baltica]MDP5137132.1 redox-sensitive transcriptional activator SoxR [Rheinheimera baltica]MDP5142975.1 redox-sensitive transcriptional activator SoxR [Rheinheimera baltica]MDP5149680.1 redox-sensitive transcriptional activator SoxR [Rheinheimera baltica]